MNRHDSTVLVSADGVLPDCPDTPCPPTNTLWLPAMKAAGCDPQSCRRFLDQIISRQRDDGFLPDNTEQPGGAAAWPLWACVAARVQRNFPEPGGLPHIVAPLRRTFRAAMRHFGPDRSGLPRWRYAQEAWNREWYRENLATPDLSVLLLREADALLELQAQLPSPHPDDELQEDHEQLVSVLLEIFADETAGRFDARRIGGGRERVAARLAVFPLLWDGLPGEWIGRLLFHAAAIRDFPPPDNAATAAVTENWMWRQRLAHVGAAGLLAALQANAHCKSTKTSVTDGQTRFQQRLPGGCGYRRGMRAWLNRLRGRLLSRSDGSLIAAVVCLLLAVAGGILRREPVLDAGTLSLLHNEALLAVVLDDTATARDIGGMFDVAGVFPPFLDWHRVRQAEQSGRWADAAAAYERLLVSAGATPPLLFGLARANGRAGRTQTAREQWQRFIDSYGNDFPVAARAALREWWRMEQEAAARAPVSAGYLPASRNTGT